MCRLLDIKQQFHIENSKRNKNKIMFTSNTFKWTCNLVKCYANTFVCWASATGTGACFCVLYIVLNGTMLIHEEKNCADIFSSIYRTIYTFCFDCAQSKSWQRFKCNRNRQRRKLRYTKLTKQTCNTLRNEKETVDQIHMWSVERNYNVKLVANRRFSTINAYLFYIY